VGLDRVSLLDHAGISTSANDYYNSERCLSSRRADCGLEYKLMRDTEVGYGAMKMKH
jgi:hypothetical protein